MNYLKEYIEQLIQLWGLTGASVSLWRHIVIIIIIILIAWLVDFICRHVFIPLILKVTKKTDIKCGHTENPRAQYNPKKQNAQQEPDLTSYQGCNLKKIVHYCRYSDCRK